MLGYSELFLWCAFCDSTPYNPDFSLGSRLSEKAESFGMLAQAILLLTILPVAATKRSDSRCCYGTSTAGLGTGVPNYRLQLHIIMCNSVPSGLDYFLAIQP